MKKLFLMFIASLMVSSCAFESTTMHMFPVPKWLLLRDTTMYDQDLIIGQFLHHHLEGIIIIHKNLVGDVNISFKPYILKGSKTKTI